MSVVFSASKTKMFSVKLKNKQTSYPIGSQPACWRSIKSVRSSAKSKMLVRREILHSTPSCWYFFVEYPIEKYRKFHSKSFLKRPREKCFCTLQKPRMRSSAAIQYCSSRFRRSQQWMRPTHSQRTPSTADKRRLDFLFLFFYFLFLVWNLMLSKLELRWF